MLKYLCLIRIQQSLFCSQFRGEERIGGRAQRTSGEVTSCELLRNSHLVPTLSRFPTDLEQKRDCSQGRLWSLMVICISYFFPGSLHSTKIKGRCAQKDWYQVCSQCLKHEKINVFNNYIMNARFLFRDSWWGARKNNLIVLVWIYWTFITEQQYYPNLLHLSHT